MSGAELGMQDALVMVTAASIDCTDAESKVTMRRLFDGRRVPAWELCRQLALFAAALAMADAHAQGISYEEFLRQIGLQIALPEGER